MLLFDFIANLAFRKKQLVICSVGIFIIWYKILLLSWFQIPNVLVLSRSTRSAGAVLTTILLSSCWCVSAIEIQQATVWHLKLWLDNALPWEKQVGVLVPTDSSGRQPGLHQAEYDFLHGGKIALRHCPKKEGKVEVSPWRTQLCVRVPTLTQKSSKAWQVLCLESKLPGGLRQQVLVCGQVLAVPA